MSAADKAYAAAVAEIERVRAEGERTLRLDLEAFHSLEAIPPEIATIDGLLAVCLSNTRITNLDPLSGIRSLRRLEIEHTSVSDLGPISGLGELRSLYIEHSPVTDLRPLLSLPKLGEKTDTGLDFRNTPFAEVNEETRRLAEIEDREKRTLETLSFLATLAPWPEPLPWETTPLPSPPDPAPAIPLVVTEAGIDLAPTGLTRDEAADPMASVLYDELVERAAELVRLGNRDDAAGRYGERLAGLLAGGLATLDPLRLHLLIEEMRRYHDDERATLDPEMRRALAGTLDVGPGLTLGAPAVQTFVERVRANQMLRLDAAQIAAQIRLTEGIAQAEGTAPTLQRVADLAKDPDRTDQFTAIRPALTRNYVLLSGKIVVGATAAASYAQFVATGHPGWLAAHAADILIAAQGWGAPYVAWIAPVLDRAQLMVAAARLTRAALTDRPDQTDP